jgi:hypothetical protein
MSILNLFYLTSNLSGYKLESFGLYAVCLNSIKTCFSLYSVCFDHTHTHTHTYVYLIQTYPSTDILML